jgi:MFS family permease
MAERRTLVVLALYQLLASNRSGIFSVYFALFLVEDKGATIAEGLIVLSAAYVASSLLGPLAGRWSDRLGRRWPFLLAGEAGSLPLFVLVPFVPGAIASGATFIAAETVLALGAPALTAYVADVTTEGERGFGYGLLAASGGVGGLVGFLVVGLLIDRLGFAALFYFVGAVMVGTLTIIWVALPNPPGKPRTERASYRGLGPLTLYSTTVSIRALGAGAVITFYGTYAYFLGANAFDISLIAAAGLLTAAALSIPLGRAVDRTGSYRGMLVGTGVSLLSMVLYLSAGSWEALVPARVVYTLGFALMNPSMLSYVAALAPTERRAEFLGVFSLVNSTLWSLGPLAGGIALTFAGAPGLFVFALVTTATTLVALPFLERRRRAPEGGLALPPSGSPPER